MARHWFPSVPLLACLSLAGACSAPAQQADRRLTTDDTSRRAATAPSGHAAHGAHGAHGGHGGHGAPVEGGVGTPAAPFDWGAVSDRDLDIASVFLVAREAGLRPALDRLRALAARDTALAGMGHVVAHALGRYAVARAGGDPAVFAQCREDFLAGCYHGVLEGYFRSPRAADARAVAPHALDTLCAAIAPPHSARLPLLECAHGMGHGLAARAGNDFRRALRSCDALSAADERGECHDGVFMELTVRGSEPREQTGAAIARKDDLRYPCDSVAAGYQPSCWEYQPIIVYEYTDDLAATARFCAQAPAASVAACHHGFGKQVTGWVDGMPQVVSACRAGDARLFGACVAGAAESYVDETWTGERALALCRQVPDEAKGDCYRMVGARMALVRAGGEMVRRECAKAEPAWAAECRRGGESRGQ